MSCKIPNREGIGISVIGEIVAENLGAYRAMPSRLDEDVSQEAQVVNDYRGRLAYELLQNADDAMADSSTTGDKVSFTVTHDELWIANTGRPLNASDVRGLCGLGASSKMDARGKRRASIGHKGLGFKSVLEVTDEPIVYSREYSFALGKKHAKRPIEDLWHSEGRKEPKSVPAMRFPVQLDQTRERWTKYSDEGFNTAFCLPFAETVSPEVRASIADSLLALPLTTVLFLKHLETVEIHVDLDGLDEERVWRVSRERFNPEHQRWESSSGFLGSGMYRVSVTSQDQSADFLVAHDAEVAVGTNRAGLAGPAWEGIELTEVSVATLESEPASIPADWRRFHVFLPTAESCSYPILVNGAFSTDLSRQSVRISTESGDYNSHLVRQAAALVRNKLIPQLLEAGIETVLSALDRGDDPTEEGGAAGLLHEALCEEIADLAMLPSEPDDVLTFSEVVFPPRGA